MSTLYMVKIGATPKGRLIEQHDIFFGVANYVKELIPAINHHWKEVAGKWHFDAYRPVTKVGNYRVEWIDDDVFSFKPNNELKLFFINFGGYLPNHFEEYHHKLLVVAETQTQAVALAKQCDFYQQYTHEDSNSIAIPTSHVDDKMEIDVDNIYDVNALLKTGRLHITPIADGEQVEEDQQVIGYISLKKLSNL